MATYVNDLRLTELATGEGSGTWGTTTNLSMELIGEALGYATQQVFGSDADATTTIADGASDPARAMYFKITSAGSLTATRTCTIAPNTVSRVMFIENATTGSQSIAISQGSGANVTILTGKTAVVYLDGAGSGAAVVDAMAGVDPGVTDTLAEVLTAGNTTTTDQKIQFRDTGIYINSSADGQLDIVADTEIQIAATTIDLNGNLDVSGTALVTGVLTTTAATVHTNGITMPDSAKAIFGAGSDLQIYHNANNSYIQDVGTGKLHITSDGTGVSIDKGVSEVMATFDTDGAVTLYHNALVKLATTVSGIDFTGTVTADSYAHTGDTDTYFHFPSANQLSLVGGGVEIARAYQIAGAYGVLKMNGSGSATYPNFTFNGDDNTGMYRAGTDILAFSTAGVERLRIDASGNVGIGISPQSFTDLMVNTATDRNISVFDNAAGATICGLTDAGASSALRLAGSPLLFTGGGGSGGESMRIDSSGNLLVGKTATGYSANGAEITSTGLLYLPAGSASAPSLTFSGDTNTGIGFGGADILYFSTGGSERMRVDASGNVGIGNSAPLGRLTISNAAGANAPSTVTAANTYLQLGSDDYGPSNNGKFMIGFGFTDAINTNSPAYIGYEEVSTSGDTYGDLTFYTRSVTTDTAPTERMRIDASGNVGIGTTSPREKVHLHGGLNSTQVLMTGGGLNSETYGGFVEGDGVSGLGGVLRLGVLDAGAERVGIEITAQGNEIIFDTAATERLRIDSSGNVGIGTAPFTSARVSAPHLVVGSGSNSPGLTLYGGPTSQGSINFAKSTSGTDSYDGGIVYAFGSGSPAMSFHVNGSTERMRIDAGGSILIGKTTPADLHNTWNHIIIGEKGAIISENGAGGIDGIWLADNAYIDADTGTYAYQTTGAASLIRQSGGVTTFSNAASGSAGAALTPVTRMTLDASGKVDVGGVPHQTVAVLNARFNGAAIEFGHGNNSAGYYGTAGVYGNNGQPYIGFSCDAEESVNTFTTRGAKGNIITADLSGNLTFAQVTVASATGQTPANRMTLDASGNLLVGKSGTAFGTAGVELRPTGSVWSTVTNGGSDFNRLGTDGAIQTFWKDGDTVGSIGVTGGDLMIGQGAVGVRFLDASPSLYPTNITNGATADASIDIGTGAARFKDLYLSGGVYLGGTGAANKLDDYEEGTWTPTINNGTFTVSGADYTKVGNLVTLRANLQDMSDSTTAATISIGDLPFLPRAQYGSGSCMFRYFSKTNAAQMTAYVGSGSTALTFYWSFNSDATWAAVQFADGTQTNMDIILTISYTTDL